MLEDSHIFLAYFNFLELQIPSMKGIVITQHKVNKVAVGDFFFFFFFFNFWFHKSGIVFLKKHHFRYKYHYEQKNIKTSKIVRKYALPLKS
jgi:hypothetical protein